MLGSKKLGRRCDIPNQPEDSLISKNYLPLQRGGDKVPFAIHIRQLAKDFKGKQIR
ncbi:hypothetical protein [Nostoc sp. NZL]|uniref:hypothetical protein n=1 Tax=Nostoc sp. NZL TaxID=2650612 RepID=UPI0018C7CC5A|nr:hypothetical protein [Nostoc sp. NZL]